MRNWTLFGRTLWIASLIAGVVMSMVVTSVSQAGLLFSYNRLALKDLDDMSRLVKDKIKESHKETGDKSIPLKEGLQAVFSRPNPDFLIEKILPPLKSELDDLGAWERSLKSLVKEALGALKNPGAFKPEAQVTYLVFLENLVSELRPRSKEKFETALLEQIRDAKIVVTDGAQKERQLRMMKETTSPSALAEQVLTLGPATAAPTPTVPDGSGYPAATPNPAPSTH